MSKNDRFWRCICVVFAVNMWLTESICTTCYDWSINENQSSVLHVCRSQWFKLAFVFSKVRTKVWRVLIIRWIPTFTVHFERIRQLLTIGEYLKSLQEVFSRIMVWKTEVFLADEVGRSLIFGDCRQCSCITWCKSKSLHSLLDLLVS